MNRDNIWVDIIYEQILYMNKYNIISYMSRYNIWLNNIWIDIYE